MQRDKRVVIKIGTKVLTSKDRALDKERVKAIVSQVSDIQDAGIKVLIVTSGAIGAGMWLLNIKKRPEKLSELQATAAIGQNYLMQTYSGYFKERGYLVGQILLTQEDFNDKQRFINIKHTINKLLEHKAVPIINENDTVATEEIRCGDNDKISSLVAGIVEAGRLVILSDVEGLLDENGKMITLVDKVTEKISRLGGKSACDLGTGGMATKLAAIKMAAEEGVECVIANGKEKDVLTRIILGNEALGTTFKRSTKNDAVTS